MDKYVFDKLDKCITDFVAVELSHYNLHNYANDNWRQYQSTIPKKKIKSV
jgi:hypothetical protein